MAARRPRVQWGYTRLGAHEIKIYLKPRMAAHVDGYTHWSPSGIWIELNPQLLQDPARLDESLIHEFLHVIEYIHGDEVLQWSKGSCSAAVQTISHGLTQMLREMRQCGVETA